MPGSNNLPEGGPVSKSEIEGQLQVTIPPERMRPLKKGIAVRKALSNLSQEVGEQNERVRLERALAFIEANKATDAHVLVTGAPAIAAVPGLMGEVGAMVREEVQDVTGDLKKKGGFMSMIAGFFGFDAESIVSDIRESIAEAKNAKGFDKFGSRISLMWNKFLAKLLGIDLSKHFKPEELANIGMQVDPANVEDRLVDPRKVETARDVFNGQYHKLVATGLVWMAKYSGKTDGKVGFMKGWDVESRQREENNKLRLITGLSLPAMYDKKFIDIVKGGDIPLSGYTADEKSQIREILKSNEPFLTSLLGKQDPEWSKKTISEVFSLAYQYGGVAFQFHDLIGNLKEGTQDLNFTSIAQKLNFLSVSGNGESSGILSEQLHQIQKKKPKGLTVKTMTSISTSGALAPEAFVANIDNMGDLSAEETQFLHEIMAYKTAGMSLLLAQFPTETRGKIQEMLSIHPLSAHDIFTLYALTGGGSGDKLSLNHAQIFGLLMLPMQYAVKNEDGATGAVIGQYYAKLAIDGDELIPPEISKMFMSAIDAGANSVFEQVGKATNIGKDVLLQAVKDDPVGAAAMIATCMIGGIGFARSVMALKLFATGAIVALIGSKLT